MNFYKNILLALIFTLPGMLMAQDDTAMMNKLLSDDISELEAVSMYPDDIRVAIFEASQHPEVLVRMQTLQKRTSENFKMILEDLEKEDQEKIWELTRYPGLIADLSDGGKKSKSELQEIVGKYPEGIRESAVKYGQKEHYILQEIDKLNHVSEKAFDKIISEYPEKTKDAYRTLSGQPEILNILTENMDMTVALGDLYKRNPEFVKQQTDSIATAVAAQNARELEEWKKALEEDPEAMEELENAAKSYANEYGYEANDFNNPPNQNVVEVHHYWNPYPYWYGYPWWYDYPYPEYNYYYGYGGSWWYAYPAWYPRPWWYHWGFYYGPHGEVIVWGMPSWHFTWWHFHHCEHLYYYPHLTNHYYNHYHHHRDNPSGFNKVVANWERENIDKLPKDFVTNDKGRVEVIKEYGHLEKTVIEHNKNNNVKPVTRDEYLQQHKGDYPELIKGGSDRPKDKPVIQPQLDKPKWDTRPQNETKPRTEPYVKPKIEIIQPKNSDNINRAKDYHQNTWDRNRVPVRPNNNQNIRPNVKPNIQKKPGGKIR